MSVWLPTGAACDDDIMRAVAAAGGAPLAARLDAQTAAAQCGDRLASPTPPAASTRWDYDVVVLGGGLSLLCAQALAQAGLRVAVVERQREIAAQRAWNASGAELGALVTAGLLTGEALTTLTIARYRGGVCRWHQAGETHVSEVLDHAIDAEALLAASRAALVAHGGSLWLGHTAGPLAAGEHGVELWARGAGGAQKLRCGVVVDGRGVHSPFARHDLVCPTVGGVIGGLEEGAGAGALDPELGEILATTEGIEAGRQHIWETFPGRPGEAAVYLFYYARRGEVGRGALLPLYRRFCARLGAYKRGRAVLVRPTFGVIPGWSRLAAGSRAPHPRVVLVGDAASRHSPLTFCGFGAFLRALGPVRATVLARLRAADGGSGADPGGREAALHAGTGALAYLMAALPARRPGDPGALNRLLGAAFDELAAMGPATYRGLLQDTLSARALLAFMWGTSRRRPEVYRLMSQALGAARLARWSARMAWAAAVPERAAA